MKKALRTGNASNIWCARQDLNPRLVMRTRSSCNGSTGRLHQRCRTPLARQARNAHTGSAPSCWPLTAAQSRTREPSTCLSHCADSVPQVAANSAPDSQADKPTHRARSPIECSRSAARARWAASCASSALATCSFSVTTAGIRRT